MTQSNRVHVFDAWKFLDRAPHNAERYFGGITTPFRLHRRFVDYRQTSKKSREQIIISAYNYAFIRMSIKTGAQRVENDISTLVEVDLGLKELDDMLQSVGTSYLEQCLNEGKLLTPKQLDEVFFHFFAVFAFLLHFCFIFLHFF